MALTESKLQALHGKKNKSTRLIPDRDGLSISCGKKGGLSWVFRYRIDGLQKRITIGAYPDFSLDDARQRALELRRFQADGNDPKNWRRKVDKITLQDCADFWLEQKVTTMRQNTQVTYKSNASKYFRNTFSALDVQSATREDWLKYFDKVAEVSSSVNAGTILRAAKTMLRWCKMRSIIDHSQIFDFSVENVGARPAQGQRNLQMHEVGLLWTKVNDSRASPATKICTKLLLIFGARNSEIREAERHEFDLDRGVWTLPAERSKNAKIIRRPIPDKARHLIQELDETYGSGGYLIPGEHRGTAMTTHALNRFVQRIRLKMLDSLPNMTAFTPHDFRRTLSTRLSEQGILPHVTEKMLGHEMGGIMAVYNKHDWIDDQRAAYEMWCEMISEAAKAELGRLANAP